ncbi:hypothetical protein GCM10009680_58560 [Streptomyces yatensis]|uniref:Uncharacterized protein n=1 Tax=Streptomyces yatensis TaxID=155177 RepID=A0ABN2IQU6_9ACTN
MGLDEILDRVAVGRLITVVGSAIGERLTREVCAVPVTDLPAATLALGWLEHTARPEITASSGPRSASGWTKRGSPSRRPDPIPSRGSGRARRVPRLRPSAQHDT